MSELENEEVNDREDAQTTTDVAEASTEQTSGEEAADNKKKKKKLKWWIRVPLNILLVLLVLILLSPVILHFAFPFIAVPIASKVLPGALKTDASVEHIALNLLSGHAELGGVKIAQPDGFKEYGDLITLGMVTADVDRKSVMGDGTIRVEQVRVDGAEFRLVRGTNGVMNVSRLGKEGELPPPEAPAEQASEAPKEAAKAAEADSGPRKKIAAGNDAPPEAPPSPRPVFVKEVLLENVTLHVVNVEENLALTVTNLTLKVNDFVLGPDATLPEFATILLDFEIVGPSQNSPFTAEARVGQINPTPGQMPELQVAVNLTGFELDTVEPILIDGAKSALGGDALDLDLRMIIQGGDQPTEQALYGKVELVTNKGTKHPFPIRGTIAEPDVPIMKFLLSNLFRPVGFVGDVAMNLGKGTLEVGKAAVDTGVEAVKGAGKTATKFAGGVLTSAKGIVTLDKDAVTGGMKDATVGTVKEAGSAVSNTTGAAAGGVVNAADSARGKGKKSKWLLAVPERHAAATESAHERITNFPFPVTQAIIDEHERENKRERERAREKKDEEEEEDDIFAD